MDEEIINQIKEAEEFASQIIKTAKNDASEMIDDAIRSAKVKLDDSIKQARQSELIAFRRLSDASFKEIELAKSTLSDKFDTEKKRIEANIDVCARKVVSKVKDKWQ
ncbi:MAG: hypothetical protein R2883_07565 [Caldisericia bacterium]